MIFNAYKKENLDYLVIDKFYSDEEVIRIKKEINDVIPHALPAGETGAAEANELPIKTGTGVFLDRLFILNRESSQILSLNRKLFSKSVYEKAMKVSAFFGHIKYCNADTSLLNYYTDNQEYKPHIDNSIFTAITMFKEGTFTGGDICFPEYNLSIDFVENRVVIFPGCIQHQAMPIKSERGYRITIAQFLTYELEM